MSDKGRTSMITQQKKGELLYRPDETEFDTLNSQIEKINFSKLSSNFHTHVLCYAKQENVYTHMHMHIHN